VLYLKKHQHSGIIALCDKELIGKVLEEGDVSLDLDTHRNFYVGEEKTFEEAKKIVKEGFSSINAVGKEAVKVVKELGLCEEKSIKKVGSVPHVHVYSVT
jgi:hypothetical protein